MALLIAVAAEAYSGKDTFCDFIEVMLRKRGHAVRRRGFADPIKEGFCQQVLGMTRDQLWGDEKEVVDPYWGFSPRWAMQTVGEGLRQMIDRRVWVRSPNGPVELAKLNPDTVYLVNDLRHPEEADAVRMNDGYTVRLKRDNRPPTSGGIEGHVSETSLDLFEVDEVVNNNSTIEDLKDHANIVVERAEERWKQRGII